MIKSCANCANCYICDTGYYCKKNKWIITITSKTVIMPICKRYRTNINEHPIIKIVKY